MKGVLESCGWWTSVRDSLGSPVLRRSTAQIEHWGPVWCKAVERRRLKCHCAKRPRSFQGRRLTVYFISKEPFETCSLEIQNIPNLN